jgi:hypothetical protein
MRGLKTWLRESQKARLCGRKEARRFHELRMGVPAGRPLRGVTRLMETHFFSDGSLPHSATHGFDPSRWANTSGRQRGDRVDKQVTRVVNQGGRATASYKLTRLILTFLDDQGMKPVLCQRVVCCPRKRVATAVDIICYDVVESCLWCVELKVGFAGDRECAVKDAHGRERSMKAPLGRATDCLFNRHALQSVIGMRLMMTEPGFVDCLATRFSITDVRAAVLYANGNTLDLVVPDSWWNKKADLAIARL